MKKFVFAAKKSQLTSINGQESVSGDLIVHVKYEFGVTRTFGPDLDERCKMLIN